MTGKLARCLTLLALAAAPCAPLQGAPPPVKLVFDRALFLSSEDARPPGDSAPWIPVSLPDEWRRRPLAGGHGWYRIAFELERPPTGMHALYLAYRRADWIDYFVNASLVGGSDQWAESASALSLLGSTVYVPVPPSLLRPGTNVIHLRMRASAAPAASQGLGRVTFGEARAIRKDYIGQIEWQHETMRSAFGIALSAGLVALCLWFGRPAERTMLLLAAAYLSWAFAISWQRPLRWVELPLPAKSVLQIYLDYGLPALAVLLCLRAARIEWRRLEAALWIYLAAVASFPLWRTGSGAEWRLALDAANVVLLLAAAAILSLHARGLPRWSALFQGATLLIMAALISSEFLRYFGWIGADTPAVRHFHVVVMFVGIGGAIFADHVLALWRVRNLNVELERRVAEKTREIESNRARREQVSREQALVEERQRIIGDMHDGLGAILMGLLRYVQSEKGDPRLEQRVKEALQELRIAIDALEASGGNLEVVLGNLRYRLTPLLESAPMRLRWDVGELPEICGLEPAAVFAVQRIVMEAVANAVRHSQAEHIDVSARAAGEGAVELQIADDGCGFDPALPVAGSGLHRMRARAAGIGAQLEVSSRPGSGTLVKVLVPSTLPQAAKLAASETPALPPLSAARRAA